MPRSLDDLERSVRGLDAAIEPIAKRPVDLSDPGAFEKLRDAPHPLDQSGTREETEALLRELVDDYMHADAEWRAGARALFRRFRSFAWAADVGLDRRTPEGVRAHVVLFSLADQGLDPRDAKLWLADLRADAPPGEASRILREVAARSSEEDRYGWGSTRQWLEDAS